MEPNEHADADAHIEPYALANSLAHALAHSLAPHTLTSANYGRAICCTDARADRRAVRVADNDANRHAFEYPDSLAVDECDVRTLRRWEPSCESAITAYMPAPYPWSVQVLDARAHPHPD
jgi:hypothetical protein